MALAQRLKAERSSQYLFDFSRKSIVVVQLPVRVRQVLQERGPLGLPSNLM